MCQYKKENWANEVKDGGEKTEREERERERERADYKEQQEQKE